MVESTENIFAGMPPGWARSLQKSINGNRQLEYNAYFQIALYDKLNQHTVCDTLKYVKFVTNSADDLTFIGEVPDDTPYLMRPKLLAYADSRGDVGRILLENKQPVELNWVFPLTKEKVRLLCEVNMISIKEKEGQQAIFEQWKQMSEEQQMAFKAAQPGEIKTNMKSDELNSYEPQMIDEH